MYITLRALVVEFDNCDLAVNPIATDRRLMSAVDRVVPDTHPKILFWSQPGPNPTKKFPQSTAWPEPGKIIFGKSETCIFRPEADRIRM